MKQDSRGAQKIRAQLEPHLPGDESIDYVSVANIKPHGPTLASQIGAAVLSGGHGAVMPVRRAVVVLTSDNVLVIVVDRRGKLLTDQAYIFPRRQSALVQCGGIFGLKHQIVDASGSAVMDLTFPVPNRDDAWVIASQLGPALS
jgi:hypothetical protein